MNYSSCINSPNDLFIPHVKCHGHGSVYFLDLCPLDFICCLKLENMCRNCCSCGISLASDSFQLIITSSNLSFVAAILPTWQECEVSNNHPSPLRPVSSSGMQLCVWQQSLINCWVWLHGWKPSAVRRNPQTKFRSPLLLQPLWLLFLTSFDGKNYSIIPS